MRYASTRGGAALASLSEALAAGLAPDGGLYMPERLPALAGDPGEGRLASVATILLAPFFDGDALAGELGAILDEAFDFPVPLVAMGEIGVLELFHGPTAAFKDFGARFLAASLMRARRRATRQLHVLVATSGDTGGAVAAAFHRRPGARVSVLYPKGMVSPTQERQLTSWDGDVAAYAVHGTFDDCQRMVKAALCNAALRAQADLSSANSINIGRLLPQMTYFAAAAFAVSRVEGGRANFVIPSGNLGHATACVFAREMGAPIGEIALAHNANRTMPDYLESGVWRPRPTVRTIASAMDVGDPSNTERLRFLYPDVATARSKLAACSVDDDAIRRAVREAWEEHGRQLCPHTAAGVAALGQVRSRAPGRWIVAATAHPAKFPEIIAPLIGREPEPHPALAALGPARRPREIAATPAALVEAIG